MKHILVSAVIIMGIAAPEHASALSSGCSATQCAYGYGTPDSTCNDTLACSGCRNGLTQAASTGYVYYTMGNWGATSCPTYETTASYSCSCDYKVQEYRCASGYYGTANSTGTSGCTKCPDNATCSGGNSSTFKCTAGYYKDGTKCTPCPSPGTSDAGATSVTECYISSSSSFTDDMGSGIYTSKCYWTE